MADFYVDSNGKVTKRKKKNSVAYVVNSDGTVTRVDDDDDDIAPIRQDIVKREEDDSKLDFFQKSKAFDDGWQFGDLTKTILGTAGDALLEVGKGVGGLVEGVTDAVSYGVAGITDVLGADEFAERTRKRAMENRIEQWTENLDNRFEQNSVLGRTSDAILQGVGQVGGIMATGGIAGAAGLGSAGATMATTGLMGISGFGSGAGEAYKAGATDGEAMTYGLISGAADAFTEMIFGGLGKAVGAVGLSKGLSSADDMLAKKVSNLFTNQITKNFAEYGIKAGAEGVEEVLAGVLQAAGKKITYMQDEELLDIVKDENLLEQFIVGAATSGMIQSGMIPGTSKGSLKESNAEGRDFITGYNQSEQSVIDKEVEKRVAAQEEKSGKKLTKKEIGAIEKAVQEDLNKGGIDIDTIEEVLGGETYSIHKKLVDAEEKMQAEYDALGKKPNYTMEDAERRKELADRLQYVREKGARGELRKRLDEEVATLTKGSRLEESFAERSRRGQKFEADVSQYSEKQRAIVQKAVDSGILNNTRRTHEFVDMVARIAADKGVSFDFTNNTKLKESGFAVEGKTVNGFVTKDGITVNIQSAKSLNSVVGHEITHVLEGTELYAEMQKAVFQYAETKGDVADRRAVLEKLYKGVEGANIDAELTADLVGDYLFTDSDFINNLSANHRNVFQKIYDEVKYLLKVATAGSKEARELEKVKRAFEKAYREGGKKAAEDGGTQYSLSSDSEGRQLSAEQREYFKDSKVVDQNGNLKVMYHGTQDGGFHEFSGDYSDDAISFFFTDSNDVAASYSGSAETYAARTLRTADDLNKLFAEVGATEYTATEEDGAFHLLEDGDEVAESDSAEGLYEEFRDWTGLGSGSVNYQAYLNLVNPLVVDADGGDWHSLPSIDRAVDKYEYIKVVEVLDRGVRIEYSMVGDPAPVTEVVDLYDKFEDNLADTLSNMAPGEVVEGAYANPATTRDYAQYAKEHGYDGVIFKNIYDIGGYGSNGATESTVAIAFSPEQIKSVANANPTADPDIRYSLSEYSEEEKKAHNAAALEHFGKTYRWAETGYLLLDGTRLDLSGKRFGAPGGYRTVDHRDIADALGADYGDGSYSGALMQFMSEGNIRISPESNGINLSVLPTKAQESSLSAFISSVRGEVLLDIDDYEGDTVLSIEYPKYTHANKVLADIRAWFESGATPEVEGGSVFRRSLSAVGEERYAFGNYNVYGEDVALEGAEDIAPVRQDIAPATVSKNATVQEAAAYEEPLEEESPYAELDRLTEQAEELEQRMYAAMDAGDNEAAMNINADLVDAAVRITELEQQLDADTHERLASIEDADAPIVRDAPYSESTDTVTLPKKMVQEIARDARKSLGFSPKKVAKMRELVEKFSQGEIDSETLYDEIAYEFRTYTESIRNEEVAEVKKWLRSARINVSDEIKSNFPDYTSSIMRPNSRKIIFAKDGADVDILYAELNDLFPGFFPGDIIQPADQLERIIEVANMDINLEESREIDGQMLDAVTDDIVRRVNEYRQQQRLKMSEQNAFAAFNSLMADADRYAPAPEEDIAPVRADVEPAAPAAEPAAESAPVEAANQPIKTVKERLAAKLHNLQTELQNNQRLREESRADYELEILQAQTAYNALKNKNTQKANNLLRRMERLRRLSGNEDARYEKRISDLEAQVAKVSEEARRGESPTEQAAMRKELHASIIDKIRGKYAEAGYTLIRVLKGAKNLSTFSTVDNTPQRVMEKALGYKEGQILADLTVNQAAANETEGIRWLNTFTDRKSGVLAQLSKKYNIKPGSKESAAAQKYAEGYYIDESGAYIEYTDQTLEMEFPDPQVRENIKGLVNDPTIRRIYDETLDMLNASRTRNAYPPIIRLPNYYLHFRAMNDTFSRLGIPFNPNDIKAKDLPANLNGMTADLKPGKSFFASELHRKGLKTDHDLLGGLEQYLTGAKNQIFHIDDIQTLRALRNYIADIFGQAEESTTLDNLTEEEIQAFIEKTYDSHLSTFAKFLNEEANVLAGKTALIDRGLEGIIGRRGMTFFDTLNRQVGANMVGFNVSSSLTNFIAPVQAFAKTNKAAFVKGFAQTVANRIGSITGKGDGFAENNPTMIRRKGADRFYRTPWQKAGDIGYSLMGAVDSLSTEIIVRSKYNELVSKGMSHEQAVIEADKWTSRLMGDRSLGQMPQLYNSKMAGLVTKFQLEVRNQLDSQFYDTIQEAKVSAEDIQNKLKRNAKVAAQVTSTFVQLAVVQHLFGKAFEAVAGYNPAFDIIEAIIKAFGWDDEEESEDTVLDNLGQGLMSLAEDMPYSSVITDGGRIPISSALPITQLIKGEDKYGNEKSRWETIAETAPYYLLPGGYGQIKKTKAGLEMFNIDEDHPIAGSYTDSGNLRFTVDDTFESRVQAAVFGQWASGNAREYFDKEYKPLQEKQIQELVDSGLPMKEYRDYRDGLKDLDTLGEKVAYIADLDLPMSTKNLLVNNIADRKEPIDLTDFDEYSDWGEFEYAHKYPKKYDFLTANNISVAQYEAFDEDTKKAWTWAYQNPEKFALSRAVSDDLMVYRQYSDELSEIKADKYADGRTVNGSRKTKVLNYLNNLDADYYTKLLLFKMEYNADDTYNREIIEYLNNRSDISFEEEVTILRELGFTVTADGTVRW